MGQGFAAEENRFTPSSVRPETCGFDLRSWPKPELQLLVFGRAIGTGAPAPFTFCEVQCIQQGHGGLVRGRQVSTDFLRGS